MPFPTMALRYHVRCCNCLPSHGDPCSEPCRVCHVLWHCISSGGFDPRQLGAGARDIPSPTSLLTLTGKEALRNRIRTMPCRRARAADSRALRSSAPPRNFFFSRPKSSYLRSGGPKETSHVQATS